jgi:hypothetical protein
MLEELFAGKVLEIGGMDLALAHSFIGQSVLSKRQNLADSKQPTSESISDA